MKPLKTCIAVTAAIVFFQASAIASELDIPATFSSGSRAVAAEVNDNFGAVKTAVDDNNTRIDTNAAAVADNTALVDANVAAISDNSAAIAATSTSQGVAFAESSNNSQFLANGVPTLVKSLTISAPRDGFVVANLGGYMICSSGTRCVVRCSLSTGAPNAIDFTRFSIASGIAGNTAAKYDGINIATGLAVPAGDTVLNAVCEAFDSQANVGDMAITAVFSTNRY